MTNKIAAGVATTILLASPILVGCSSPESVPGTVTGKESDTEDRCVRYATKKRVGRVCAAYSPVVEYELTIRPDAGGDEVEVTVDRATYDSLEVGDHFDGERVSD